MSMNPGLEDGLSTGSQSYRRYKPSRYAVSKETFVRVLLTTMFYVALWRASGMWYGYPGTFDEDVSVDPLPQKIMLYSLIPMLGMYVLLEPNRVLAYLKKIPAFVAISIFFCFASLIVSINFGASLRGLAAVVILTAAPLMYRFRYGNTRTFEVLTNFAIISAYANILYIIAFPQFAIMGGSYAGMVKGLFYHKNGLGQFCAINLILLISLAGPNFRLTYKGILKTGAVLLTTALLVIAQSSTAVVMVAMGLSLAIGLKFMQRIGNHFARSFIVFVACILIGLVVTFSYLGLAASIAESFGKDLTFSGRTGIWEQLMPLIYERPVLGYGFAVFRQPEVMAQYVQLTFDARSTHNTYIELALNIGVPGMLAWLIFILRRFGRRMVSVRHSASLNEIQAKEAVFIFLVIVGSMTEAGMMMAPVILWPFMVIALVETPSPPRQAQRFYRV